MAEKILHSQADRSLVSEGKPSLGEDENPGPGSRTGFGGEFPRLRMDAHLNTMVGGKWSEDNGGSNG